MRLIKCRAEPACLSTFVKGAWHIFCPSSLPSGAVDELLNVLLNAEPFEVPRKWDKDFRILQGTANSSFPVWGRTALVCTLCHPCDAQEEIWRFPKSPQGKDLQAVPASRPIHTGLWHYNLCGTDQRLPVLLGKAAQERWILREVMLIPA